MASEFFVSSDVTFGKNAAKELPRILKEFKAKNVMLFLLELDKMNKRKKLTKRQK